MRLSLNVRDKHATGHQSTRIRVVLTALLAALDGTRLASGAFVLLAVLAVVFRDRPSAGTCQSSPGPS